MVKTVLDRKTGRFYLDKINRAVLNNPMICCPCVLFCRILGLCNNLGLYDKKVVGMSLNGVVDCI